MIRLTASQARKHGLAGKKRSKYRAVKTVVDDITFASKKEAKRYGELKALQEAGEIIELELQPKFELHDKFGNKVCTYLADFRYREFGRNMCVVEDCKGFRTPVYKLKKKWVESEYGIKIVEI